MKTWADPAAPAQALAKPVDFAPALGFSPKAGQKDFDSDCCGAAGEPCSYRGCCGMSRGSVTPACSESKASSPCCCHCPCPAWAPVPRAAEIAGIALRTPSPPQPANLGRGKRLCSRTPLPLPSPHRSREEERVWGALCPTSPPGEQRWDPQHLFPCIPPFSAARARRGLVSRCAGKR